MAYGDPDDHDWHAWSNWSAVNNSEQICRLTVYSSTDLTNNRYHVADASLSVVHNPVLT